MNDFSVYYPVYDNQEQTEKILTIFRAVYPGVHIRLLCDKGSDHTTLSRKYNCEYVYSDYHLGLWGHQNVMVVSGEHCYGWNKEEAIEYLNRMLKFAISVPTKYLLYMEDDIYITKPIRVVENEFPFTQVIPGNKLCQNTVDFCKKFNPNHTIDQYGCCAGQFMNRELYLDCVNKTYGFLTENYDELSKIERHLGWPDTLNNLVFNLCGFRGISNPDYSDGHVEVFDTPIFHSHFGKGEKWAKVYSQIRK